MKDVASNLVAPTRLDVLATEFEQGRLVCLDGLREKTGLEQLGGSLLVLRLRPLVLALRHDARGDVGQPHGRVRLVDVLAAGTGGAERIHPDLVPVELPLDVALAFGQDFYPRDG